MKIFCISDTESDPEALKAWIKFCRKDIETSDKIFHLGDGIKNIKKLLSKYKVLYIKGNHDSINDYKTNEIEISIKDIRFYLFHGRRKNRIAEKINILSNHVKKKFNMNISLGSYYKQLFNNYKNKHDIVLYGHMHTPRIDVIENTVFFCPGSFSKKSAIKEPTYAIIQVSQKLKNKKVLEIEIFSIGDRKKKIAREKITLNPQ